MINNSDTVILVSGPTTSAPGEYACGGGQVEREERKGTGKKGREIGGIKWAGGGKGRKKREGRKIGNVGGRWERYISCAVFTIFSFRPKKHRIDFLKTCIS